MRIGTIGTMLNMDEIVLKRVRKDKSVIYGGQALSKQLGFMIARPTYDWDIKAKNPKKSAINLRKDLEKDSNSKDFFNRESYYTPGVHKVLYKGEDGRINTKDDVVLADFSKLKRSPVVKLGGVKYVSVDDVKKDKMRIIKDKQYTFRHEKDQDDLNRINEYKRLRRVV